MKKPRLFTLPELVLYSLLIWAVLGVAFAICIVEQGL